MSTLADVIREWEQGAITHDQATLPRGGGTWFIGRVQTDGMVLAADGHIIGTTWKNHKILYRCPKHDRLVSLIEHDDGVQVFDGCPSCDVGYGVADLGNYAMEKLGGQT